MAGITAADALAQIQALSNSEITVQNVKNIVAQVDASVGAGKTAIFNSGQDTLDIAKTLKLSDSSLALIGDTQIGILREDTTFQSELQRAIDNDITVTAPLDEVLGGKRDVNGNRIANQDFNSIDDIASGRYASQATGNVKVIVIDPDTNSVFIQSELDSLMNNGGNGDINGVSKASIVNANGGALNAIQQWSAADLMEMDASQTGVGKSGAQLLGDSSGWDDLMARISSDGILTPTAMELAGKAAKTFIVVSMVNVLKDMLAADDAQAAADIFGQFVQDNTNEVIAGAVAGGVALVLLATFTSVPLLVGAAIVLVAQTAGEIFLADYVAALEIGKHLGVAEVDPRVVNYVLNGESKVLSVDDIYVDGHHVYGDDGWTDVLDFTPNLVQGVGNIVGTDENDLVLGGVNGETLNGGAGGNDTLVGGGGNDTLIAGYGNDVLDGGEGIDTADFSNIIHNVAVNLGAEATLIDGDLVKVGGKIYNVENVITGAGNDTIYGSSVANVIEGGSGNDTLDGGAGADTFVFSAGDSGVTAGNRDVILDFEDGVDKLDFSAFSGGKFIGGAAFGGASNEVRAQVVGGNTILQIDTDGDSSVDMEIELSGQHFFGNIEQDFDGLTDGFIPPYAGYTINGTDVSEELLGDDNSNSIKGKNGDDTIYGFGGVDGISGGIGNDVIIAGAGNDRIYGQSGDDTLYGGAGNDTYYIRGYGDGLDTIIDTGSSADSFFSDAIDEISGFAVPQTTLSETYSLSATTERFGNEGQSGSTRISRVDDDIHLDILYSDVIISNYAILEDFYSSPYHITLIEIENIFNSGADSFSGTVGNDKITGTNVFGDLGSDWIIGSETAPATLSGGAGNDSIYGGSGADSISGDEGNDGIFGGYGNNTLYGGFGNDFISGSGWLNGGEGNDYIEIKGSTANPTRVSGGAGSDIFALDGAATITDFSLEDIISLPRLFPITLSEENGVLQIGRYGFTVLEGWDVSMIDDIKFEGGRGKSWMENGTDGDDEIVANPDALASSVRGTELWGNAGDDTIHDSFKSDTIYGGDGVDTYVFKQNYFKADKISGFDFAAGEKIDLSDDSFSHIGSFLDIVLRTTRVQGETKIDLGGGHSLNLGNNIYIGYLTEDNFIFNGSGTTLMGTLFPDTLIGGLGDDIIFGEGGDDFLEGAGGADTLYGGAGNDFLEGDSGHGDDVLYGDEGNDTLWGNGGNDTLTGGSGADIFLFVHEAGASDVITDFEVGNPNEKINLSDASFAHIEKISDIIITQNGADTILNIGLSHTITLNNVDSTLIHL